MKVLRVGTQYTQATFTNSPRLEATFERNFPAVYCYGISLYYSNIVIKGVGIIGLTLVWFNCSLPHTISASHKFSNCLVAFTSLPC